MTTQTTLFQQKQQSFLALQIVEEEFGTEMKKVLQGIIEIQPFCTLNKLNTHLKLKEDWKDYQIKEYLVLLLKNNLIKSEKYQSDIKPEYNDQIIYQPNFTQIFGFLRHIYYLNYIKNLFGREAFLIIEYIINNQCANYQECSQVIFEEQNGNVQEEQLQYYFLKLIKENYLTRQKNWENIQDDSEKENEFGDDDEMEEEIKDQKENKKQKNKAQPLKNSPKKKLKKEDNTNQNQNLAQQVSKLIESIQGAQNQQNQQLSQEQLQNFIGSNFFGAQGNVNNGGNNNNNQLSLKEQIQNDFYLLKDPKDGTYNNYYLNHRKFIHDLRTKEICTVIEGKVGITHRYIVQAMLDHSQKLGRAQDFVKSERLTLRQIMEILPSELRNIKENEIKKDLDQLKLDGVHFVDVEYIQSQPHYYVNVKKIIKAIQFRHIAKIIERKYDLKTARIFRILKQYKCLDENTVTELSLLTPEQVRSCLQILTKDGFISYDSASEKDKPQPLIQAYTFNKIDVKNKISLFNLKVKLQNAYNINKEIEESENKLERVNEWKKILKMIKTLEIAILELDSALIYKYNCKKLEEQVNLEDCVKRCENKAEEECENPDNQDLCRKNFEQINKCVNKKLQYSNDDFEKQSSNVDNCIEDQGHIGIINYNKCIDKCIDIADPEELLQFQHQALKDDDEYQKLLKSWEQILENEELNSKILKNFLEQFGEESLLDQIPTEEKKKQQKYDL
ncbi:hypothetical protein PPERSA_07525 [Pseudocohnilembus persalinus]|uniref:DNA-directed RNA polymerase III subunit RPC3 n=1 Tax=Pseudocohnilembus persalinus TaxID=266149 RepID=A0A0V0QZP5_PSEPJ|nr:hypothetical protein PPERSA_07525 [Pseudocohnilembus persalinus]|eukprot:KRX07775.1 hypothetical protein PPERSA_07525 [Pseudocohnilembus persalinus]